MPAGRQASYVPMDNVCHSLAGAAIAEAGWARRLPRAVLLGVIAANIPDVDALTYVFASSPTAVAFRRGWTHGLPAVALWATALAFVFAWWARRRPPPGFGREAPDGGSWRARDFLLLAAIATLSHPVLDWMNTYGVRFLMPFSDRWFYGDTLFIVDLTLIGLLAAGWTTSVVSRRGGKAWSAVPARAALTLAVLYIAGMHWLSADTRAAAIAETHLGDPPARDLMVAPQPAQWRTRDVLVRAGDGYDWRRATWRAGSVTFAMQSHVVAGSDSATVAAVRATRDGRNFLRWARFPYFVPGTGADTGTIFVGDARYSSGTSESWAGIRVRLARK